MIGSLCSQNIEDGQSFSVCPLSWASSLGKGRTTHSSHSIHARLIALLPASNKYPRSICQSSLANTLYAQMCSGYNCNCTPVFHPKIWTKVLMRDFCVPLEQTQSEKYHSDILTMDQSNPCYPFFFINFTICQMLSHKLDHSPVYSFFCFSEH